MGNDTAHPQGLFDLLDMVEADLLKGITTPCPVRGAVNGNGPVAHVEGVGTFDEPEVKQGVKITN